MTTFRPQIVIIDDMPEIVEMFCLALSGRFTTHGTTDPETGLELALRPEINLVLTDYRMPQKSGLEIVRILGIKRPELPCIVFSGMLDRVLWVKLVNAGCTRPLPKPIALDQLMAICTELTQPKTDGSEEAPFASEYWQEPLGKTLSQLTKMLNADRPSKLFLHSPDGFSRDLASGLCSLSQNFHLATPGGELPQPMTRLLFVPEIETWSESQQAELANQLTQNAPTSWIIAGTESADDLLDQHRLAPSLYLKLTGGEIYLPCLATSPQDVITLCHRREGSAENGFTLSDDGHSWLAGHLSELTWPLMQNVLQAAAHYRPDGIIDSRLLDRALLARELGANIDEVLSFEEYASNRREELARIMPTFTL